MSTSACSWLDTMVRGHLLADREAAASHNSDIVILAGDIVQLSWSWTHARIGNSTLCTHDRDNTISRVACTYFFFQRLHRQELSGFQVKKGAARVRHGSW